MSDPKLTTYEELDSLYRTAIVATSSGMSFKIQTVSPGDFMIVAGSPILKKLVEHDVDLTNKEQISAVIDGMSTQQKADLVSDGSFLRMARQIVCAGVISINFVDKLQDECDRSKQEVSVDRLPMPDLLDLFTGIMTLAVSEDEEEAAKFFREISGGERGRGDQDSPDGESIRDETVENTISLSDESEPDVDSG